MTKYISILRGINVGGKRKILMKDLKELYHNLGFLNVETYIQSGNVIFDSDFNSELDRNKISNKIEKAIFEKYAFEVPVILRTKEELLHIQSLNPFIQSEKEEGNLINNLHLTFLESIPMAENIEKSKEIESKTTDKFEIIENNIFIFCNDKYHTSKLTNNFFEKKLKTKATTRNWKTIKKLGELISKK
ncbi:hypothetical protein Fleli_1252 [Bernardetia litoralis DSM 6794]|uniref:DUF1697 domain-containing protein n=1 Tax=Bernardetia litoralis (strain ATCC 23117 / DSM 6794 / NBRC 15988 / NCIMB 1366 / Fx l1 / Sio-4) TaxID=880071 RepID=I4AIA3_BERLS|nr:DUF1697 domain-containing protein [Bernardetia litoralis]AFM03688.1 hypothetical protein Fleli_1252 [Bernardetia litoralis DSM 6794]